MPLKKNLLSPSCRILGLELLGARNDKTTFVVLDLYEKEKKVFVKEIVSSILGDKLLLKTLQFWKIDHTLLAIDAPLTLPPFFCCQNKPCEHEKKSNHWVEQFLSEEKTVRFQKRKHQKAFLSYVQRPLEVWVRSEVVPHLDPKFSFETDETLGGTRAPRLARALFLRRKLQSMRFLEVWPRLVLGISGKGMSIPASLLYHYRDLLRGGSSRAQILDKLSQVFHVFIYAKDAKVLTENVHAFDAFLCAFGGYLDILGLTYGVPKGFPLESGWAAIPDLAALESYGLKIQ